MKERILLIFVFVLLLAACGPANEPEDMEPDPTEELATAVADPTRDAAVADPDIAPRPTITPRAEGDTDDAYPALPEPTLIPDGYPVAEPLPTRDPYPGVDETAAIVHPVGEQCGEPAEFRYADMQDATADLISAGIEVLSSTTISLIVTDVCGGPTSSHYLMVIDAADLEAAEAIDWTLMPE